MLLDYHGTKQEIRIMVVKRLITDEEKAKIKLQKRYKGRNIATMTTEEKDNLLDIIAKKLNLI